MTERELLRLTYLKDGNPKLFEHLMNSRASYDDMLRIQTDMIKVDGDRLERRRDRQNAGGWVTVPKNDGSSARVFLGVGGVVVMDEYYTPFEPRNLHTRLLTERGVSLIAECSIEEVMDRLARGYGL